MGTACPESWPFFSSGQPIPEVLEAAVPGNGASSYYTFCLALLLGALCFLPHINLGVGSSALGDRLCTVDLEKTVGHDGKLLAMMMLLS